jgi:hypothetical protein
MKTHLLVSSLIISIYSCGVNAEQKKISSSVTSVSTTSPVQEVEDSIFKIADFLFEAKKNSVFEYVKKGGSPQLKTKGDTLYSDQNGILLGDKDDMLGRGIYKKFAFKSNWEDSKVQQVYKGKLAAPNFSTDKNAKHFITAIKEGCQGESINFAGHYTIVEWGCGALCQEIAIVDRITGKIFYSEIPFDTADGHSGTQFKIDSRRLVINTEALSEFDDYEAGYKCVDCWRKPAVFEMVDGKLKHVE